MRCLNLLDYIVIGVYCTILMGLGVYLWRRASASLEDYFLAGRNLPWWALGVSGMTNFLDMTGTMIIVSFLYMLGPRGIYVEFRGGAVLVLVFLMLWTGKWHYRSKCMTGAEWQIYRFGTEPFAQFARIISALAAIVGAVGMIAYLIKGAGLFLSMFLPYSPMVCAVLMVSLTTIYTMISGFYGVVYNDMFQAGVILISVFIISVMAAVQVFGYDGSLAALALEVTGNPDWVSSVPHRFTPLPAGYEQFQHLQWIAFFYLMRNVLGGMGSGADPRYFGARNERECGLLTFFWTWLMTFRWPMMIGFAVLGLLLVKREYPDRAVLTESAEIIKQHLGNVPKDQWEARLFDVTQSPEKHPELTAGLRSLLGETWDTRVQLVSYEGTVNAERILPAVILTWVPMGVRGLFIASLLAAAMSTLSPQVNSTTAFFTRDIYQAYLRHKASNRELIGASYVFSVFLVAAGFAMAYKTKNINDIWDWIIMGLGAGLAMPGLLRLYWWRFNGAGVFFGVLAGLTGAVLQRVYFSVLRPDLPDWSPHEKFLILTTVGLAGAIGGTYLGKPTNRKVLEHFYRTTRPFGFWGPLKAILPPEVRAAMTREHFYDLISVPFAFFWQVTLFLLPMQLIIGNWRSLWVTLVIFLVSLGGLLRLWYRHLPPAPLTSSSVNGAASGGSTT